MRSKAVHPVIEPLRLAVKVAFNAKHGKLIRDYTSVPARRVRRSAASKRQDFRRSPAFITGTKRAYAYVLRNYLGAREIGGALGAIGRYDDPAAGNWVFSELRQNLSNPQAGAAS